MLARFTPANWLSGMRTGSSGAMPVNRGISKNSSPSSPSGKRNAGSSARTGTTALIALAVGQPHGEGLWRAGRVERRQRIDGSAHADGIEEQQVVHARQQVKAQGAAWRLPTHDRVGRLAGNDDMRAAAGREFRRREGRIVAVGAEGRRDAFGGYRRVDRTGRKFVGAERASAAAAGRRDAGSSATCAACPYSSSIAGVVTSMPMRCMAARICAGSGLKIVVRKSVA